MSEFYDSIKDELEALDIERGGPSLEHDGPGGSIFGMDYNTNVAVMKQVQAAINSLGYSPPLVIDGAIGPKTIAAVKWVQAKEGVAQDGIVGDQTLGALGITPPGGTSIQSVTGAVSAAFAALQQEFAPLLAWAASNPQPIVQGKGVAPGFAATKASVVNSFTGWSSPMEGFVPHMYIDALGYVTTGMGDLIDPVSQALALPWKHPDGSLVSQSEVVAAWNAVDSQRSDPKGQKQTSGPAVHGGGSQGNLTSIRITKDDVNHLVAAKLKSNEANIVKNLPGFAQAPADAQLGVHSMSWAEGTGFTKTWPQFDAAFNRGDYATAAAQSHMQGVGIDMRNMANKLLFTNAAQVVASKRDPDLLYYIGGLDQLFGTPMGILANVMKHPLRTIGIVVGVFGSVAILVAAALKGNN